jgi:Cu-Zn family superoxide dismutase
MKMKNRSGFLLAGILIILALGLIGCAQPEPQQKTDEVAFTKAIAVLHPTAGNNVHGTVTFTKMANGIQVVAHVEGLTPGDHGFHIHEFGDCSAPDATSAGAHFEPLGKPHGAPTSADRHVGDLGNITAGEDGSAHLEWLDTHLAFSGQKSIIGRAIIVHANPDDLTSQPTGNAGGRVACGVIGIAK